jgi:hypothetical protein
MSLAVTATALQPIAPAAHPAPSAEASKTTSASSSSNSQQTAALNRLVGKYKTGIQQGLPVSALASLARQITAAGKVLGQTVILPKASATASAAPQAPSEASASNTGLLNKLA